MLSNLLLVLGMSFLFGGLLELGGMARGAAAQDAGDELRGASEPLLREAAPKSGMRIVMEKDARIRRRLIDRG